MRSLIAAAFLTLLWAGESPAKDSVGLIVQTPERALDQGRQQHAYFSEEDVRYSLAVEGGGPCQPLAATLVQVTTRLEAELDQRQLTACEAGDDPNILAGTGLSFAFVVPKVERKSRFEWRFASCPQSGGPCNPLLALPFTAYPRDLLAPLRSWAKTHNLVIRDPDGDLQDFLDQQRISYTERLLGRPEDSRVVTLIVDRRKAIHAEDLGSYAEDGSIILFRENTEGLPHVKSTGQGGHRLISVEMPLTTELEGRPLAQEIFLEIFRMSQEPEPSQ